MVAWRGDLPVLLSSILQFLHLEGGGGVQTTPVKPFTLLSLFLSLPFFFSFDPLLLDAHRSSTRRSRLGLYDVRESRLRNDKREAKQTNIQKGATPALLNKTKRRATAKFA